MAIPELIPLTDPASLSVRRAWIEIMEDVERLLPYLKVALRKESVDRNERPTTGTQDQYVALRKESVDRNETSSMEDLLPSSRSP